jgi:glutamate formiminotransferase
VLVAYNVWLDTDDPAQARQVAAEVRGPGIRALGMAVDGRTQVSMNLVEPLVIGPAEAYDRVAERAAARGLRTAGAELVGLLPARALARTPKGRWAELDLSAERTIEWRIGNRRAMP